MGGPLPDHAAQTRGAAVLDRTEPLTIEVGGANTVVFADGQRHGYNTDVPGMGRPWPRPA